MEKKRKFYVYEPDLYKVDSPDSILISWEPDLIKSVVRYSVKTIEEKQVKKEGIIIYLETMKEEADLFLGCFRHGKEQFAPDVLETSTFEVKENPRKPDQVELSKTHFGIRKSDGVLFLESFAESVCRSKFEEYLRSIVCDSERLIWYKKVISREILRQIRAGKFVVDADIKLRLREGDGRTDAIGQLSGDFRSEKCDYMRIGFGRSRARKWGIPVGYVVDWICENRNKGMDILSGTIKYKDQNDDMKKVKIDGMEETVQSVFQVDSKGMIDTECVYGYLKEQIRKYPLLKV